MSIRIMAVALSIAAVGATAASAAVVNSYDNGAYNHNGIHGAGNSNTYTGYTVTFSPSFSFSENRSFYAFDLAGVGPAKSISVTFLAHGIFRTDTGSETIGIFDYTGAVADLVAGAANTPTGGPRFADLGNGEIGRYTLTAADNSAMPEFTVDLSQSFVDQFNAALLGSQKIAIGAAMLTGELYTTQGFWGSASLIPSARLTIVEATSATVPEPAALGLLGLGILGAAGLRRRKA